VAVGDLRVGDVIARLDKKGVVFDKYNEPLDSISIVKELIRSGVKYVFVKDESLPENLFDDKKEEKIEFPAIHKKLKKAEPAVEEIRQAINFHNEASKETKSMLENVRLGKSLDVGRAEDIVEGLVDNCMSNPSVFASMSRLKDFDNYTFVHSLNASIIAIAVAEKLGHKSKLIKDIGLSSLLHDVGKMKIPDKILNKPGRLTELEFKIMKSHPEKGYEILKDNSRLSPEILCGVMQHHEKADGSGYPSGLMDKQICNMAKVISICDVYDALTSDRVYHKGRTPSEALKIIFEGAGTHFNNKLVKFFINLMGIYPVGAVVVLSSKELGIVYKENRGNLLNPQVLVFEDQNGRRPDPYVLDMAKDNSATPKKIMSSVDPKKHGIDVDAVFENYADIRNSLSH